MYANWYEGYVSHIEDKLRKIELKALKAILKLKKGTTNDLVYHELRRLDIISKIKDCQYKFFDKLVNTDASDATIRINQHAGTRKQNYELH